MNLKIRKEKREDYSFTERLIKEAFAHETYSDHNEHKLVAKLRQFRYICTRFIINCPR